MAVGARTRARHRKTLGHDGPAPDAVAMDVVTADEDTVDVLKQAAAMLHPVAEILRSSATQLPRKRMFDAYIMLHCFAEQFALDYKIEKSQVNTSRVYDPTIPQFSPINAGQQPTADTVPEEYAQSDEEEEDEVESSGEDEANGSGASAVAEDASIVDPESAENTIAGANDSSALLSPICMSLSDEIGVDVIRAAQHDFFHALLDLKTSVRQKDDTVVEKQLGSDGAANATNFFFRDCMGLQVMRRLTETIDAHNSNPQLFASRCATRAAHLVQDEEVPFRIRRFFGSVLAVVRSQAPKPIQAIYQMQQHIELLAEYNKLVEELGAGATSENAKFLIKKGYSTSRGRGWASAARLYLQDSLALTKGQVNNLINNAYVLTRIVKLFGRGMLLVLPRNAVKQIERLGLGKDQLNDVLLTLQRCAPFVAPICEQLDAHVFHKLESGKHIAVRPLIEHAASPRPTLLMLYIDDTNTTASPEDGSGAEETDVNGTEASEAGELDVGDADADIVMSDSMGDTVAGAST